VRASSHAPPCFLQANHPIWKKIESFAEAVTKLHANANKEAESSARSREIRMKREQHLSEELREKFEKEQQAEKRKEREERLDRLKKQTQAWKTKLVSLLWEFDSGEIYMPMQEEEEEEERNKSKRAASNSNSKEASNRKAEKEAAIEKSRILSTYNICGDKPLHICMLVAYSYPNESPARTALLEVAKEFIWKNQNEGAVGKDMGGSNPYDGGRMGGRCAAKCVHRSFICTCMNVNHDFGVLRNACIVTVCIHLCILVEIARNANVHVCVQK
jgi:hypothetical protein